MQDDIFENVIYAEGIGGLMGVKPVVNTKKLRRFVELSGALSVVSLPAASALPGKCVRNASCWTLTQICGVRNSSETRQMGWSPAIW